MCVFGVPYLAMLRRFVSLDASCEIRKKIVDPSFGFENDSLRDAYIALQVWNEAILSDPKNLTQDWVGPN